MHSKKSFTSYGRLRKLIIPSMFLIGAAIVIAGFLTTSRSSEAAPFVGCDTNGYLYKYPSGPTQIHEVDMVTGQDSQVGSIAGRQINAIGYNPLDNFIYGWDDQNDVFVRVHSDHATVDVLTIDSYTGPSSGIIIGDVDDNGHYWMLSGNTWYQIDLTTTPNPTQINTATPPLPHPAGSAGADWAYVPGTNALWRIMDDAGAGRLWSFDRTTTEWTHHTAVTPIAGISGADLTMGAFYADPNGFLYGSSNTTGNVWRVDVNSAPYTAGLVGTGDPSSSNDGARCASAPIPIDFGDAPSSYTTLFNDDGPRHSVIGYQNSDHTAELMLGKKLDIETDGFPGAEAHGDDDNDIDDEEGVQHIVATPGTPTALSVPVTVTNNTSDVATLAGWIDLDNNGTFDTGERVTHAVPANSGTGVYELNFPETTFIANTFARFRVFDPSVADPQPIGSATGGEVEDYLVQVGTYEVEKTSTPASGTTVAPGDTITYTLDITNTGLTDLINLTIHDNLTDVLDDATLVGSPAVDPASSGTATVDSTGLEFAFTGDVLTGQKVTVTYEVQINTLGSLGNGQVTNMIIAAHSNCHPVVINGQITAADSSGCQTSHPVDTSSLANTGNSVVLPIILAGGFIALSGGLYLGRKQLARQKIR
jgi:fimbrial isopeptide formation D2 family protein